MIRKYIYTIIAIVVLITATISTTYSFFMSQVSSNEKSQGSSKKFEVIYTGGKVSFENKKITPTAAKTEDFSTSVSIRMAADSVLAKGTIYININKITSSIANDGFIWEVYGSNGYYNQGTFDGYNDTDNKIINIAEDFEITYQETIYKIYFWLDGNNKLIDNRILNAEFDCYIGAKTENFTGATIQ